jgi:hypothetical protein
VTVTTTGIPSATATSDEVVEIWAEGWVIVELGGPRRDVPIFATTTITDVESGLPITSCLDVTLSTSGERAEWICEATTIADQDGKPLIGYVPPGVYAERYTVDGEPRTARFRWIVKEFRLDS